LKQNFRAAVCHVLHYSCNVNAAVADSLHCRMICGTVPSSTEHGRDHNSSRQATQKTHLSGSDKMESR